jgi:WD40 repeat protein
MLAVTETGTVFLSQDAGEAWARVGNLGVPLTRLVGDPSSPTSWFATGPAVYRTDDSGATWTSIKAPADVEDRAVDAQLVPDGLLVVWERDGRVEATKDRGATWAPPSARPTVSVGSWASALAVDPADAKHWMLAMRSLRETWAKDDPDGGCWETRDAGTTWTKVEVTGVESGNAGVAVAIDATGAAWYAADGAGIFRRDGAAEAPWADVTPAAVPKPWWFVSVVVASAGGEVLFASENADGSVRTIVRSADAGKTWTPMDDPGARVAAVTADPSSPGRYLAGDLHGGRGVLVFGSAAPTPPKPPEPPPGPTPPKPPEGASVPVIEGLLGVAATAQGAHVLDLRDGKVVGALGHPGDVLAVAVSRDGARLFTGGADRAVGIWERGSPEPKGFLRGAEGAVTALAVSPDGTRLYAGDNQWTVVVWDLAAGKEAGRLAGHTAAVTALALSADGTRLASASADGTVRVWDVAAGKEAAKTPAHEGEVRAVALSPDGTTVFSGGRSPAVRSFDAATGAAKATFDSGLREVLVLAASPDGSALYAAGAGEEVVAWSLADGKPGVRHAGAGGPVLALAVAPDGKSVAAGGADGSVRVWDAGVAAARGTWPTSQKGPVLALALAGLAPATPPAPPAAPPAPPPAATPEAPPPAPPPAEPPAGDPPAKR